ncbi:sigma-70 family RNA polymerase sigma factor [Phyllobacterium myrsinacearum]|nr:sigma-70 family RNA polymerase sigma factor [Phyllobacterium myrsinacearum]PWV89204.1 RNA polymerase sigma-70 factor (ECF subfamily) [Phyllobacterium myrsinacearum]RZS79612.1 RNA polymerase sigma-70 factor (ECF subfamily) [Phyllobacterium myrsinacearum]RZV05595.1 RNA polymerase sigma-70 factor (ECF subfamily) [Phyllobacterium myrsinacearum]
MPKEKSLYDENVLVDALVKYKNKLIVIAESVVHSHAQAEDIFHDAIVKACTMQTSCIHCPVGYACRMVYNLALDEARKRQHEKKNLMPMDGVDSVPAPCVNALDCIVMTEALNRVMTSLKDLPKRTHDAFIRHRIEGVPQKDIAEELGVSRTLVNFMIKDAHRYCEQSLKAA